MLRLHRRSQAHERFGDLLQEHHTETLRATGITGANLYPLDVSEGA